MARNREPSAWMEGAAIAMILIPIWYPAVEEDGFRWPRVGDIPFYLLAVGLGLFTLWWERWRS